MNGRFMGLEKTPATISKRFSKKPKLKTNQITIKKKASIRTTFLGKYSRRVIIIKTTHHLIVHFGRSVKD